MSAFHQIKTKLLHCGQIDVGENWQYDSVISPFCRIYIITEGKAWIWHHHQKFELAAGNIYLIPSFTSGKYRCDSLMSQIYVHFLEETESGLSIFDQLHFSYARPALQLDNLLFDRLIELNPSLSLTNIDPKSYDNQANLLGFQPTESKEKSSQVLETHGILVQLLSRFVKEENNKTIRRQQGIIKLRSVLSYIQTHLSEKLTVNELAEHQH